MGLSLMIARRSLLQRPGRTFFSILGVALGVATVVGVVTLDHATIEGYARPRQAQDRPDIELTAARGETATSDLLEGLEGISAASKFFQNEVMVGIEGDATVPAGRGGAAAGGASPRAQLLAIEARYAASFGQFGLAAGADLSPDATENEVLIGPYLVEEFGLDLGDEIFLSRPVRAARQRCEDGQLVAVPRGETDRPNVLPFRVVGILTREGTGRAAGGNVAVVDYEVGRELYRGVEIQPRFWAVKDPGVDLERLQRSLGATYSYALNRGIVVGQAADERAFRTGVRMLGLLALVLGLYVIFHTLSMSLTERVLEVGTLHALGATRGQIGRVFFTEAVLLAGAGALVGVLFGVLLAFVAVKFGITTLGVGKYVQGFVVPWGLVGTLALLGFLVALVGSVYPLVAIGGANTLSALRGDDALRQNKKATRRFHLIYAGLLAVLVPGLYLVLVPVVGEMTGELVTVLLGVVGLLTLVVVLSLVLPVALSALCAAIVRPLTSFYPLAGRLATRAMQDAPARVGVSACALGLVAAGFVGLHGMTASLSAEVTNWAEEAVDDKVWARNLPPTNYEELSARLAEFPGVVGVEKASARQFAPFLVIGMSSSTMGSYGVFAEEAALADRFETERTIILSRRLARDLDYAIGDSVQMKSHNGVVLGFEVLAISDAYGFWPSPDERMYGVISDHWMRQDFCLASDVVTEVCVRFDDSAPMTDAGHLGVLKAALRDVFPEADDVQYRIGEEIRDYALKDIGRDFFVFDLLLLLMAGLASLGVLNGQLLATLERSRELGVLKALGADRGQVGGAMLLEAIVVGVAGGGLGVLLGLAATPFVVDALDTIAGLSLPKASAGWWIPMSFAGAVFVSAVASLYPIRRAREFDAVRAVRTK
ncbi:ABC transporter permease YtrF precursor [Planctomycetes bacterium Poly30]|uniref:ABC transporter permease YtrF n=1 Tax=Saltatorellus ferox TaxID=2528018 RepID=A0A518EQ48_9BACT|nr:ABC transporter permease YtrF precursor [Planctomycetes bacterium Poly30]